MIDLNVTTTLRTGEKVPDIIARTTYQNLQALFWRDPAAFFEAVALARDPHHQLHPGAEQALRTLTLLDRAGRFRDPCRKVLLAAGDGEGLSMVLLSYAETTTTPT